MIDISNDPLQKHLDSLRNQVRLAKGWWTRIARDSGCRRQTLLRFAADEIYDPAYSEMVRVNSWFTLNGTKTVGPQGKRRTTKAPEGALEAPHGEA